MSDVGKGVWNSRNTRWTCKCPIEHFGKLSECPRCGDERPAFMVFVDPLPTSPVCGKVDRVGDWLQCFSGETFFVFDPRVEEVHVEDIAHHLSLLCRYSGACKIFYGVGEHSVRVSHEVECIALRDMVCRSSRDARTFTAADAEVVRQLSLWGLLHDASEAYLGDMIRPLKIGMPEYRKVEDRVQACICQAFGLDPVEPPVVKIADRRLLATERRDLMPPSKLAWRTDERVEPLPERIVPMSPAVAEIAFMDRFNELRGR